MTEQVITIRSADFINPPYISCPACERPEFGVLMVVRGGYVRRCRNCLYDERFPLPPLDKKILLLDQFAISNLMKVLHPEYRERVRRRRGEEERFWLELFERLDRLVKLQALVCPSTQAHWEESLPAPYYDALRRMYEHLAADVRFEDRRLIKHYQVLDAFIRWLELAHPEFPPSELQALRQQRREESEKREGLRGPVDQWMGRLQIQARLGTEDEWIDDLRRERTRLHAKLEGLVDRWKREKDKRFEDHYRSELDAYGASEIERYLGASTALAHMWQGTREFDPEAFEDALHSEARLLIGMLEAHLHERDVPADRVWSLTLDFLTSDALHQLPFLRIACGMFAAIAVEAARQQAPKPDRGMVTDINTISSVLPYSDAAFVDDRCRRLLEAARTPAALDYEAAVFSTATRDELLAWLDELEGSVDPAHVELVREVYGDAWLEPYTTIFESQDESAGEGG